MGNNLVISGIIAIPICYFKRLIHKFNNNYFQLDLYWDKIIYLLKNVKKVQNYHSNNFSY